MVHSLYHVLACPACRLCLSAGEGGLTGAHVLRYRTVVELGIGSVKDCHEELVALC